MIKITNDETCCFKDKDFSIVALIVKLRFILNGTQPKRSYSETPEFNAYSEYDSNRFEKFGKTKIEL
jgi:hypothetical protein